MAPRTAALKSQCGLYENDFPFLRALLRKIYGADRTSASWHLHARIGSDLARAQRDYHVVRALHRCAFRICDAANRSPWIQTAHKLRVAQLRLLLQRRVVVHVVRHVRAMHEEGDELVLLHSRIAVVALRDRQVRRACAGTALGSRKEVEGVS